MSLQRRRVIVLGVVCALVVAVLAGAAQRYDDRSAPDDRDRAAPGQGAQGRGAAQDAGDEAEPDESEPDESGPSGVVTLAIGGDVHFEAGVRALLGRPRATLGPVSPVLREADVAIVNLESALATRASPTRKELEDPDNRYWFRSPPAALDLLARSGVDVVSMANNHGVDHGRAGLRETLRIARDAPVAVVGVDRDARRAYRPHRVEVGATTVAVLAADASPRESADGIWAAGNDSPGLATARQDPPRRLLGAVRRADRAGDLVVLYLHWGQEGARCPTGDQRRLAGALAEAGADVVVGAHAHELQGAGMLGDTYVGYGLGNLLWYHGRRPQTGVLRLRVVDGEVRRETFRPAIIPAAGGQPRLLQGRARAEGLARWRDLRSCTRLDPVPGEESRAPDSDAEQAGLPAYDASVRRIGPELARRMRSSHDPDRCPVQLEALRHLTVSHVDFEGRARTGEIVVHRDHAVDVVGVFRELYDAGFPIRRMRLVDAYGGDDDRSMAADNTSGYNCRRVAGTQRWSRHAFGDAVDINPRENPYVTDGGVQPPSGRRFAEVSRAPGAEVAPGVIRRGGVVARAFERIGWSWGGTWSQPDYQHFTAP